MLSNEISILNIMWKLRSKNNKSGEELKLAKSLGEIIKEKLVIKMAIL